MDRPSGSLLRYHFRSLPFTGGPFRSDFLIFRRRVPLDCAAATLVLALPDRDRRRRVGVCLSVPVHLLHTRGEGIAVRDRIGKYRPQGWDVFESGEQTVLHRDGGCCVQIHYKA